MECDTLTNIIDVCCYSGSAADDLSFYQIEAFIVYIDNNWITGDIDGDGKESVITDDKYILLKADF